MRLATNRQGRKENEYVLSLARVPSISDLNSSFGIGVVNTPSGINVLPMSGDRLPISG